MATNVTHKMINKLFNVLFHYNAVHCKSVMSVMCEKQGHMQVRRYSIMEAEDICVYPV